MYIANDVMTSSWLYLLLLEKLFIDDVTTHCAIYRCHGIFYDGIITTVLRAHEQSTEPLHINF